MAHHEGGELTPLLGTLVSTYFGIFEARKLVLEWNIAYANTYPHFYVAIQMIVVEL